MYKKISDFLIRFSEVIFCLMAVCISLFIVINDHENYRRAVVFKPLLFLSFALVILFLLIVFIRFTGKRSGQSMENRESFFQRHPAVLMCVFSLIVFVIQYVLVSESWIPYGADVEVVMSKLTGDIRPTNLDWYLSSHPNNLLITGGLTWVVPIIQKITHLSPWPAATILSAAVF